jgi:hypothetical protein
MSDWNYLNRHRVRSGTFRSDPDDGFNGAFNFPWLGKGKCNVLCIASDGLDWQHVSVSLSSGEVPTWEMMCKIKELFFEPEHWVVQFHPAKADYVNIHDGCLHLWRPTKAAMPTPPKQCV